MAERCGYQEIPVQVRIPLGVEFAEVADRKGVLEKTADKPVVDTFRSGMFQEGFPELYILNKNTFKQKPEIGRLNGIDVTVQTGSHLRRILRTYGKVIRRIVSSFCSFKSPVDGHLESTVKNRDPAVNFHIIIHGEIADSHGIRLPDLTA